MDHEHNSILIIDDEALFAQSLSAILRDEGFDVKTTAFGKQGLEWLSEGFAVVILDIRLPDIAGIDVLRQIARDYPQVKVIMIGAVMTLEIAAQLVEEGAYSFLAKPFEVEQLNHIVKHALAVVEKEKKNTRLMNTLSLLYQVSKEMEGVVDLSSLAGLAVQYLCRTTNIDVCAVMLFDSRNREFYFSAVQGVACDIDELGQKRFRLDEKLYTQLVRNKYPVHIPEIKTLPEILRYLPLADPRSLFIFPLVAHNEIVGIAVFISRTSGVLRDAVLDAITTVCDQVAQSLYNANHYARLKHEYLSAVGALVQTIEGKDQFMRGHSEGVAELAVRVARKMRLARADVEKIQFAGLLHDIGKVAVSEQLLGKKESLTTEEYYQVKMHTIFSSNIVRSIDSVNELVPIVLHHHERYDGKGYPEGLKAEAIPLGARIIAVCDAFKAMTSERAYRRKISHEQACKELQRCAGTQFDPLVVDCFVSMNV